MSDQTLVVSSYDDAKWRIHWFIDDYEDIGGALGEEYEHMERHRATDSYTDDEWNEHLDFILVTDFAYGCPHDVDRDGFYWPTERAAKAVLRQIKAARKVAASNTPWPEWAKQALSAGWKAPKGWKP